MYYGILGDVTYEKNGSWVSEKKLLARFTVPLTVRSNEPITMSDTLSLKRYVRSRGAQRWEIETNVEPLTASANELFALLVAKGYSEPIQIIMPQNIDFTLYGTNSSAFVYVDDVNAKAGAEKFKISNSKAEAGVLTKKLSVGLFIQFSSHPKIYMIKAISPNSREIQVYPKLREDVYGDYCYFGDYRALGKFSDSTNRNKYTDTLSSDHWRHLGNAVVMPAYLDTDSIHGMSYQDGILMDLGTLKFVEALT